jgi:hypothetical protein
VKAVNDIFRGMNLDLTNETVVRTNLELEEMGDRVQSISQQLVQPKLIHGIIAQDPAKVIVELYTINSYCTAYRY